MPASAGGDRQQPSIRRWSRWLRPALQFPVVHQRRARTSPQVHPNSGLNVPRNQSIRRGK